MNVICVSHAFLKLSGDNVLERAWHNWNIPFDVLECAHSLNKDHCEVALPGYRTWPNRWTLPQAMIWALECHPTEDQDEGLY